VSRPLAAQCWRVLTTPRVFAQTGVAADIKAKYAADPELYKLMEAKIAEADKPGVRATVAAPKAPHSCKYTEEGTLAYYLMQHIAKVDRRMVALSEIEVTLTGADKAKWAEDAKAYYMKELEEANASLPEGDKVKPDLSGLPAAPASFKIA
jgi:hypothetical protein